MTDDIQKIIASLRVGDYEDPTQKIDLLAAAFEPTLRSVELWTRGPKEAAVARGLLILSACADSYSGAPPNEGIIRQYDLGLGPRIKDNRTGRVTTRVHHVLKGEVDPVMDP